MLKYLAAIKCYMDAKRAPNPAQNSKFSRQPCRTKLMFCAVLGARLKHNCELTSIYSMHSAACRILFTRMHEYAAAVNRRV